MFSRSASVGGLVGPHNPSLKRRDEVGFATSRLSWSAAVAMERLHGFGVGREDSYSRLATVAGGGKPNHKIL